MSATLCCLDSVDPRRAIQALERSRMPQWPEVLLITDKRKVQSVPQWISRVEHAILNSKEDYSHFVLYELPLLIETSMVQIVQWDGFVLRPEVWKDEWMEYDYIGSPWLGYAPPGHEVGNGGFSLRSKRLMMRARELAPTVDFGPEDRVICDYLRDQLKDEFKFAPIEEAIQYSVENRRYEGQFGFHGHIVLDQIRHLL